MSEAKRSAAGPILAFGFSIALIMLVGFLGVFFLLKYNHDRAAAREQQAREEARAAKLAEEREAAGEKLSAIGSFLGDAIGDKVSDSLGDDEKAQLLKDGLEKLGEKLGREIGESDGTQKLKDGLTELAEKLQGELETVGATD